MLIIGWENKEIEEEGDEELRGEGTGKGKSAEREWKRIVREKYWRAGNERGGGKSF